MTKQTEVILEVFKQHKICKICKNEIFCILFLKEDSQNRIQAPQNQHALLEKDSCILFF